MSRNRLASLVQRSFSARKLYLAGTGWRIMWNSEVANSSFNRNGLDLAITCGYSQITSNGLGRLPESRRALGTSKLGWILQRTVQGKVIRQESTSATSVRGDNQHWDPEKSKSDKQENREDQSDVALSQYWGVTAEKNVHVDGTAWPWNCFKPTEAHISDVSIDLSKHHKPELLVDKVAFWTVKLLRIPTDLFFQKRYGCRAMMLETVAAVPGMVGGMLLHLKSLRRFEHSGGWIKALLEEAENERMHLMTFMEVAKPVWYERALVIIVQGIFFNAYFLLYVLSPRLAHRIVGYLEEEAIYSYTEYLKEIDKGHLPNLPAPAIAIDYWRLPKNASVRDVVIVVRADEAHHRDVNHFAADIKQQGKELREAAAPVGYH